VSPESIVVLDTSILVALFRGSKDARTFVTSVPLSRRWISAVTAAELVEGCRNRQEIRKLDRELRRYNLAWITEAQSQLADRWHRRFRLSHGVGYLDSLIGAAAFSLGATVATLNDKHFRALPGLEVIRPFTVPQGDA
jgi:predicted nucleic acid-binding protein